MSGASFCSGWAHGWRTHRLASAVRGTCFASAFSALSQLSPRDAAFVDALRVLGYVEDKNLQLLRHYPALSNLHLCLSDDESYGYDAAGAMFFRGCRRTLAAAVRNRLAGSLPVVVSPLLRIPSAASLVARLARAGAAWRHGTHNRSRRRSSEMRTGCGVRTCRKTALYPHCPRASLSDPLRAVEHGACSGFESAPRLERSSAIFIAAYRSLSTCPCSL